MSGKKIVITIDGWSSCGKSTLAKRLAKELGYVVKLLAIAKDSPEKGVDVRVHPAFLPQNHPLAAVNDVFNAIFVKGNAIGEAMFYGRGAGALPTASAVLADVIAVVA